MTISRSEPVNLKIKCPYDRKYCSISFSIYSVGFSILTCTTCPRFDRKKYDETIAERQYVSNIPKDLKAYPLTPNECSKSDSKAKILADCMNAIRDENDYCTPLDLYKEIKKRGYEITKMKKS